MAQYLYFFSHSVLLIITLYTKIQWKNNDVNFISRFRFRFYLVNFLAQTVFIVTYCFSLFTFSLLKFCSRFKWLNTVSESLFLQALPSGLFFRICWVLPFSFCHSILKEELVIEERLTKKIRTKSRIKIESWWKMLVRWNLLKDFLGKRR